MKKIYCLYPDSSACGLYRARLPHKYCAPILENEGIELEMPVEGLDWRRDYDAYIFHRLISPQFFPYLLRLKERGKKIIWETDDNLLELPNYNPAQGMVQAHDLEGFRMCLELADDIMVTTENLKQQLGHPDKTHVLPNLIDLELYPDYQMTPKYGPTRILWAGSNTHSADIDLVVPAIKKIADRHKEYVQFVFFGMVPSQLADHPNVLFLDHVPLKTYPAMLSILRADIGLCPLVDNDFNQAKSAIKWMEYSMVGTSTIASNVGPYKEVISNGTTGLLVDRQDDWEEVLENEMKVTRQSVLAYCGYKEVLEKHSWDEEKPENGISKWLDFFKKVVA